MKNWVKWAEANMQLGFSSREEVMVRKRKTRQLRKSLKRWNQAVWSRVRARMTAGFHAEWKRFYNK